MDGLDEQFLRIQIFENDDQYKKFVDEVTILEKYEEKIQENVTQYYAQIQFNFINCLPLNILMNAIDKKYLDVQSIQIKNISIAILDHFLELKRKSIYHGNIIPQNIIIEFKPKQNSNQTIEIKQIYFTNYCFQITDKDEKYIRAEDEKQIKEVIFQLWNLIENHDSNLSNERIEDILYNIKKINIQQETKGWTNKLKSFIPWSGNDQIKILSSKIKEIYPQLQKEIDSQIEQFINQKCQKNCDSVSEQQEQINQVSQIMEQINQTQQQDLQENNDKEKESRIKLNQEWQHLIQNFQNQFLKKLKELLLQHFVEEAVSYILHPEKEQKNEQTQKGSKDKTDLNFIIDQFYLNTEVTLQIFLEKFDGIQATFQEEWKRISGDHFKDYKFDFDLNFQEQVEQHFNELFAQNSKYISDKKKKFSWVIEEQKKLIIEQLNEKYDQWISYKILDLISSLI